MGLGDFLSGVKDAAVNVAKGAAWVADPRNLDDIAEGAGKAASFVAKNPGKTWDTAFEVGRAVAKDQLDPVNLAINAGLLAATVATGGAAAPAFVAKLGMGAKSLEAGVSAAKGIDTAVDVAKGVKTGLKAADVASDTLKAADTVKDVAKGVETVSDTAKTGSKLMRAVDKGLGLDPGRFGTKASNVLNPLENSRFGAAAMRQRGAQRMLEAGGESPGLVRQVGAAMLQGGGRGAGGPAQLAGMSDKVYAAQKMAARAGAVGKRLDQAGMINEGVEVAADPMKAAEDAAYAEADRRGIGKDAGYTDRGQTAESLYGGTSSEQVAIGPGSRSSAFSTGSQVGQPPSTSSTAAPASTSAVGTPGTVGAPGTKRMAGWSKPGTVQSPAAMKGGYSTRGQHFWEGPRSQWAGGVGSNYDWRPVDPLRKISAPSTTQAGRYKDAVKGREMAPATEGATDTASTMGTATPTAPGTAVDRYTDQGAPVNFAPEVPKSGMYAMSQGQAPAGTGFPTARMGEGGRTRHHTATTLSQPVGAIGPGASRTGNAVIDADSSSPDDFKFDQSGQGYFDFANTMGTAAVGQQPNTSPMYSQGSRTSRRSTGMLGV